eukprot:GHVL01044165.1.p1 GENE.GHVL01044165.1~~GHVL01044165.1.p1  ORF type:complete len:326 (-),score=55.03 GHVL01044165.1:36-1013(-)
MYRFASIHKMMHPKSKLLDQKILKYNEKYITLNELKDIISVKQCTILDYSALINIESSGEKTWDYNYCKLKNDKIATYFDDNIIYGDGSSLIYQHNAENVLEDVKDYFKNKKTKISLIEIGSHGSEEKYNSHTALYKNLEKIAVSFAETSIIYLSSCYSGKYHSDWSENSNVILLSSDDGASSTYVPHIDFIDESLKGFANKGVNLLTILEYVLKTNPETNPCFSGTVSCGEDTRTYKKELISNVVEFIASDIKETSNDNNSNKNLISINKEDKFIDIARRDKVAPISDVIKFTLDIEKETSNDNNNSNKNIHSTSSIFNSFKYS